VSSKHDSNERQVIGFLGVGMDNRDGHQRLTQSEHFVLVGGSEKTHEHMQDTAIRFTEALQKRGRRLHDASLKEVIELLEESAEP
jgi:hypothetical protein